jgi:aromatic ring-opening dioxygenase catalytic subunit (LigB family)
VVGTDASTRAARLTAWETAPAAREAHPREEHLLPLHVAAGAAGSSVGRRIFSGLFFGSVAVSSFQFD